MKKLTVVSVLALVLAACGDSSGSDSSPAAQPESPATTAAPAGTEAPEPTTAPQEHEDEMEEPTHMEGDDHSEEEHQEDGHSDETTQTDEGSTADRTIEVAMTDFAYDPDIYQVGAGETVEFIVSNLGAVEHEFRLSNEHRIEEHIAAGHQDHDDEGGHHEDGDLILLVDPGETGSIVVTFTADTELYTQVACLLPGHYEAGMHVPFAVEG